MGIRLSGMSSGLDTDAIIKELVSAYRVKTDNIKKQQTKLEWKQDAWKDLNAKIYKLYSTSLTNLRMSASYNKKKTTVSDDKKASVVAANNAVSGSQTLEVKELATTGYLTGGKVTTDDGSKITTNRNLSALGVKDGSSITVTKGDGSSTTLTLRADMKVSEFVSELKAAGVTASFDEGNQRFFISSAKAGADENFTLTADNSDGLDALKEMGLYGVSKADQDYYKMLADDSYVAETQALKDAYALELDNGKAGRVEYAVKVTEESIIKDYNKYMSYSREKDAATAEWTQYETDMTALETDLAARLTPEQMEFLRDRTLPEPTDNLPDDWDDIKNDYEDLNWKLSGAKTAADNADSSMQEMLVQDPDLLKKIEDDGAGNVSLTAQALEDITTAVEGDIDTAIAAEKADYNQKLDNKIAYAKAYVAENFNSDGTLKDNAVATAIKIDGADAKIVLNGAEYTSSTNNFSVNGLTITAKEVTGANEVITLTTDTDIDGIYNSIKNFLKEYNELIKEMDTLFNAKAAKGYEPLTNEEKEEMSEKEIEQWEEKIKESLLRRDSSLEGITSMMKSAMQKAFEVNGKSYTLAAFGIKTAGYFTAGENEKGVFHIDGDPDDELTSSAEEKLKAALASDPDTVSSFFSQLISNLYTEVDKKMKSTPASSAFTVYNDKDMKAEHTEYGKKVSRWEDYVKKQEDYWYSKFTAMEKALATLNSNTAALSSMLGTNN